jgi:hydroxyethylthiazole kinase-like sugar kinase family protein
MSTSIPEPSTLIQAAAAVLIGLGALGYQRYQAANAAAS